MILLGSTGSIGCSAIEVAQQLNIPIQTLVAGKNIDLLNQQIKQLQPRFVAIADQKDIDKLNPCGAKVFWGQEGMIEAISASDSSLVLNALVGFAGLEPTLHAISLGKRVALANKESLVSGGWLIDTQAIIPVDSEHFSLWHLCQNHPFKQLYITASGGAFRDTPIQHIPTQNAQNALKHPNWKMGQKITIDSASMANKLFELLEGAYLFHTPHIDALIERQSLIHAMVAFCDGSISLHLAKPDMKLALSYALDPLQAAQRSFIPTLDLQDCPSFRFETIDPQRYPLWQLKTHLLAQPKLGIILNASNEVAVDGFLQGKYNFGKMLDLVLLAFNRFDTLPSLASIQEIKEFDQEIRLYTRSAIATHT
ncbi:1-deoxy-D-xylulose-5-phosphate reductoisomerase [Helicobacter enhydrae]|uniref:1-deoxy-D-xylulose 5-phosphate reductoisomerase n=1 Tax=Helicobacter enhydrae TaxID=222136 RepID=A0A1B1U7A4_9HELI|nr:1-deoxy-D-xylulose-5-phosphate reductoisomerase [Helicobacter enhydrae]ANV98648.1 1-deoxy-D-xylulose-5-phosphate reductoisomerase [Helicobacter enhydrae]